MKAYLDTSFIIALHVEDPHSDRANSYMLDNQPEIIVSDFATAEFSAAIARHVRMGKTTAQGAKTTFANFDAWMYLFTERAETNSTDVKAAEAFIRRLDVNLCTSDALHIAIALRIGAALASFDERMAANAGILGMPVVAA